MRRTCLGLGGGGGRCIASVRVRMLLVHRGACGEGAHLRRCIHSP